MANIADEGLLAHATNLKDKVLLITGAANGIGKAIALSYAQSGAKVVIGDIDITKASATVKEIESLGSRAVSQKCNVTSWEDQESLFEFAIATFGRVDVVIPNAGVGEFARFSPAPSGGKPSKPDLKTMDVNLTGVLYTTRLALYYLARSPTKDKALIFIGSIASINGLPKAPLYVTSKHALIGLARTLYAELHPVGIRVAVICPWFADTDILGAPVRVLLAGMPWASIERISGAAVLAATDPDLDTDGSCYTIPDGGSVFRIPRQELTGGIYGVLNERVSKVIKY